MEHPSLELRLIKINSQLGFSFFIGIVDLEVFFHLKKESPQSDNPTVRYDFSPINTLSRNKLHLAKN